METTQRAEITDGEVYFEIDGELKPLYHIPFDDFYYHLSQYFDLVEYLEEFESGDWSRFDSYAKEFYDLNEADFDDNTDEELIDGVYNLIGVVLEEIDTERLLIEIRDLVKKSIEEAKNDNKDTGLNA